MDARKVWIIVLGICIPINIISIIMNHSIGSALALIMCGISLGLWLED